MFRIYGHLCRFSQERWRVFLFAIRCQIVQNDRLLHARRKESVPKNEIASRVAM